MLNSKKEISKTKNNKNSVSNFTEVDMDESISHKKGNKKKSEKNLLSKKRKR
jgi:hypothetical protein